MQKEWFREQFRRVGCSQSDLALHLNIEPSAVSRALNGGRRLKAEEVVVIADFFDVSPLEVLHAVTPNIASKESPDNEYNRVPMWGVIQTENKGRIVLFNALKTSPYVLRLRKSANHPKEPTTLFGYMVRGEAWARYPSGSELIFSAVGSDESYDIDDVVIISTATDTAQAEEQVMCIVSKEQDYLILGTLAGNEEQTSERISIHQTKACATGSNSLPCIRAKLRKVILHLP